MDQPSPLPAMIAATCSGAVSALVIISLFGGLGCAAATQIGVVDVALVEQHIRAADRNGDGVLSIAEVGAFLDAIRRAAGR